LNTAEIGGAAAIEQLVRGGNRLEGRGLIEVMNVPSMVLIDSKKIARPVRCARSRRWRTFLAGVPAGYRYLSE
jgi:hypothetical protein